MDHIGSATRRLIALLLFFLWIVPVCGQERIKGAFWNVENLFDTIPNLTQTDIEFTPEGERAWNSSRYWFKLGRLSRMIAGMGGASPCVLVGLCEVENDSVVYDLTHRTHLNRLGYDFLISHSSDVRGINVALLYQPMRFMLLGSDSLRVSPLPGQRPTRDILHAWGRLPEGDTLDVFVLHLPSRKGGRDASLYRQKVLAQVRHFADSVAAQRSVPLLLLMGDFNADAHERMMRKFMSPYTNLTLDAGGSYYYRREWSQIDNVLVSPLLTRRYSSSAWVFRSDVLLHEGRTGVEPHRTYLGTHYSGGMSDHLPVCFEIERVRK